MIKPEKHKCIACNSKERITIHHIVPRCYSAKFPRSLINNTVKICDSCHIKYEKEADIFKIGLKNFILSQVEKSIIDAIELIQTKNDYLIDKELNEQMKILKECLGFYPCLSEILNIKTKEYGFIRVSSFYWLFKEDFLNIWSDHFIEFFDLDKQNINIMVSKKEKQIMPYFKFVNKRRCIKNHKVCQTLRMFI